MIADTPPLTLNDLLSLSGIEPKSVVVLRHKPYEPRLNRIFEWLVSERRDLFDCYQSTHGANTESAIKRADYVVSCIRHPNKAALFVGLYRVASFRTISVSECVTREKHQELMTLGMSGNFATDLQSKLLEFDLTLTEWHASWIGKLILNWSGPERAWYRWADRNQFPVRAVMQESLLLPPMPRWDEIALTWSELAILPQSWATALRHWRGIYLIIDQSDGKKYVGSAYGAENMLQRWHSYSKSGHGGNKLLRSRDPTSFRFSILQRVSPDLPDTDVIELEQSWKHRLQTRSPSGLNEN